MGSMNDTILLVDDEDSVRRTFHEWLVGADLGCRILTAHDAETALVLANEHSIDLAILDWNLGAGNDGLRLLEDLYLFNPDVVAILVTGYAHQATPLDAMRMGVRDYLDKNHDLSRETFVASVRRQLERIRPAKRERRLHHGLAAFREAVAQILPLAQSAAALHDPVPLSGAVRSLFRFLMRTTGATAGVLVARSYDETRRPPEAIRVYDAEGAALPDPPVEFARSLAGSVASLGRPSVVNDLEAESAGLALQPFECGKHRLLAVPIPVQPGLQVVIELFDKLGTEGPVDFTPDDQRFAAVGADLGAELLRHALAERQTHRLLLDAVAAALGASESVEQALAAPTAEQPAQLPPAVVLDRLREGLRATASDGLDAETTLLVAEEIRQLAARHGRRAVEHCLTLLRGLRQLLDGVTGIEEPTARP